MVEMPAGEMSFLLRFEVDSIAFHFPIHIFRESRKRKWYVTIPTLPAGGQHSRVCFPPADVAAGSTQPSEQPQAGHPSIHNQHHLWA